LCGWLGSTPSSPGLGRAMGLESPTGHWRCAFAWRSASNPMNHIRRPPNRLQGELLCICWQANAQFTVSLCTLKANQWVHFRHRRVVPRRKGCIKGRVNRRSTSGAEMGFLILTRGDGERGQSRLLSPRRPRLPFARPCAGPCAGRLSKTPGKRQRKHKPKELKSVP
jgi:hypothetical protein